MMRQAWRESKSEEPTALQLWRMSCITFVLVNVAMTDFGLSDSTWLKLLLLVGVGFGTGWIFDRISERRKWK